MALVQFLKSRKQTAVMLDLVEETLNQVPFLVPMFVIIACFFAVFTSRDDRFSAFCGDFLQKQARIIRTVRNCTFKIEIGNQFFSLGNVMPLAARQPKPQRVSQGIYAGMDFGAEPSSAAAERLGCLATVFLDAPAAHGWARTTVLSRRMFSMSGSSAKC